MTNGFEREACFWSTTRPGFNDADRERTVLVDGEQVREKFPQRGHLGDYDDRRPAPGIRSIRTVRHDGNVVDVVYTNAAACLDAGEPYGRHVQAKARNLGWFALGQCPVTLLRAGTLHVGLIADRSLLDAQPCDSHSHSTKRPCPHAVAERDARLARYVAAERKRMASWRDPQQQLLDAQREQTSELVKALTSGNQTQAVLEGLTAALAPLIAQLVAAQLAAAPQPAQPPSDAPPAPALPSQTELIAETPAPRAKGKTER